MMLFLFQTLDLPLGRKDSSSQSVSTASTTTSSPSPASPVLQGQITPYCTVPPAHHHLHRVHYMARHPHPHLQHTPRLSNVPEILRPQEEVWIKAEKNGQPPPSQGPPYKSHHTGGPRDDNIELASDYSYVQFARNRPPVHEYSYPTLPQTQRPDSITQIKKQNADIIATQQPPLPTKGKKKKKDRGKKDRRSTRKLLSQRSRCVYCNEMFSGEENRHGACEDAPDKVAQHIERISCICCARGLLYHCMADTDGDYGHPCGCDPAQNNNCKKWTALTVLALFVPCLWCYWPLTACYRCGVAARCCGGQHKAAWPGANVRRVARDHATRSPSLARGECIESSVTASTEPSGGSPVDPRSSPDATSITIVQTHSSDE